MQELFLWKKPEEIDALLRTERGSAKLREELADCALFLLHLSDRCGVDLSAAVRAKLAANAKKYPVDKSKAPTRSTTNWSKQWMRIVDGCHWIARA